jgi:hypothetical protein
MNLPVGTPCRFESGPVLDQSVGSPAAHCLAPGSVEAAQSIAGGRLGRIFGTNSGKQGALGGVVAGLTPPEGPFNPRQHHFESNRAYQSQAQADSVSAWAFFMRIHFLRFPLPDRAQDVPGDGGVGAAGAAGCAAGLVHARRQIRAPLKLPSSQPRPMVSALPLQPLSHESAFVSA